MEKQTGYILFFDKRKTHIGNDGWYALAHANVIIADIEMKNRKLYKKNGNNNYGRQCRPRCNRGGGEATQHSIQQWAASSSQQHCSMHDDDNNNIVFWSNVVWRHSKAQPEPPFRLEVLLWSLAGNKFGIVVLHNNNSIILYFTLFYVCMYFLFLFKRRTGFDGGAKEGDRKSKPEFF